MNFSTKYKSRGWEGCCHDFHTKTTEDTESTEEKDSLFSVLSVSSVVKQFVFLSYGYNPP